MDAVRYLVEQGASIEAQDRARERGCTRSTDFLVDVMHDATQLYPEGCAKAEEYKSTAGFTIGASSVDVIIRVKPTKESDWD